MRFSSTTRMLFHLLLFMGICVCYGITVNKTMASSDTSTANNGSANMPSTTALEPLECPCGTITMVRNEHGQLVNIKREICKNPSNSMNKQYCFQKIVFAPCKKMLEEDCSKSKNGIYIRNEYGNYQKNAVENGHLFALSINNYAKLDNGKLTVTVRCAGLKGCRQLFRDGLMASTKGNFHQINSSLLPWGSDEMKQINAYLKQSDEIKNLTLDYRRPPRSMESDHLYAPEIANMIKPDPSTASSSTTASSTASSPESTSASSTASSVNEEASISSPNKFSGPGKKAQEDHETMSTTPKTDSESEYTLLFWIFSVGAAAALVGFLITAVLLAREIPKYMRLKEENAQLQREIQEEEALLREETAREIELQETLAKCIIHEAEQKAKLAQLEADEPVLVAKLAAEQAREVDVKASIATITERNAEYDRELQKFKKNVKKGDQSTKEIALRNNLDIDERDRQVAFQKKLLEMKANMALKMAAKIEGEENRAKAVE